MLLGRSSLPARHAGEWPVLVLAAAEHHADDQARRKSLYPSVRHFPAVENPDRFNAELAAFVKECLVCPP